MLLISIVVFIFIDAIDALFIFASSSSSSSLRLSASLRHFYFHCCRHFFAFIAAFRFYASIFDYHCAAFAMMIFAMPLRFFFFADIDDGAMPLMLSMPRC